MILIHYTISLIHQQYQIWFSCSCFSFQNPWGNIYKVHSFKVIGTFRSWQAMIFDIIFKNQMLVGANPNPQDRMVNHAAALFFKTLTSPFGKKEKDTGGLNRLVRLPIMFIHGFVLFDHLFHVSADGEYFLHFIHGFAGIQYISSSRISWRTPFFASSISQSENPLAENSRYWTTRYPSCSK